VNETRYHYEGILAYIGAALLSVSLLLSAKPSLTHAAGTVALTLLPLALVRITLAGRHRRVNR
jgi:hypothetical protein